MVFILKELPNYIPKWLYHFIFLQLCMRFPDALHPLKHLVFSIFYQFVLICISLRISDVEHFLMCLLVIYMSFLWSVSLNILSILYTIIYYYWAVGILFIFYIYYKTFLKCILTFILWIQQFVLWIFSPSLLFTYLFS